MPRNWRSLRRVLGWGKSSTALTLVRSGVIPLESMWWPRKSILETPNSHLAALITTPYSPGDAGTVDASAIHALRV
uniref:Uncharacterized protein n=1 Tax=Ornithodoros erraticus TaxID=265619 RepID=A0A293LW77_ORNER